MAELLTAAEAKHLVPLAAPALLTVTSATHTRIVDADVAPGGSQRTLRAAVSASALPQAALGPALRRLLRPGGVVAKRLGTRSGAPLTQLIGQVARAPSSSRRPGTRPTAPVADASAGRAGGRSLAAAG